MSNSTLPEGCWSVYWNLKNEWGGGVEVKQEMFVVHGLHMPLIGCPAIEALGLLVKVDSIAADAKSRISQLFP